MYRNWSLPFVHLPFIPSPFRSGTLRALPFVAPHASSKVAVHPLTARGKFQRLYCLSGGRRGAACSATWRVLRLVHSVRVASINHAIAMRCRSHVAQADKRAAPVPNDTPSVGESGASSTAALRKEDLYRILKARLDVPVSSVRYVLEQVKQGATVPFLARYRRDETNNMDEVKLRQVIDTAEEVSEVHRRRQFMLKSLEKRGLLTDALRCSLLRMVHLSQLEDAWEPFREKKTSLASRGREAGLGYLAEALLRSSDPVPKLRETLQRVKDGERLLVAILVEEIHRCDSIRQYMLNECRQRGLLKSSLVSTARKKVAKEMDEATFDRLRKNVASYDGRTWSVRSISGHNVLALGRGEANGTLKVEILPSSRAKSGFVELTKQIFPGVARRIRDGPKTNGGASGRAPEAERHCVWQGVEGAYEHTLKAAQSAVRRDLRKSAEQEAILVFALNLRQVLLQRPLSGARVLAMDPGITHGVKCVALDEGGSLLSYFKCALMEEEKMKQSIKLAVETKRLNKIVIGNGTASQRTTALVAETIKAQGWNHVEFAVVSEAGASVYSVSDIAKEEFPTLDVMYRGAVSIGRRVIDPLSELVKVPVRSMGIGMYQHDVNAKELTKELNRVVESCVARVGVNASSANRYVMEQVPGITKKVVDQIVLARHAGKLNSRDDLRKVPGMTEAVFQQVAGFLRLPNSTEPLDGTNIHPESYTLVRLLIQIVGERSTVAEHHAESAPDAPAESASFAMRRAVGRSILLMPAKDQLALASRLGCGVETLKLVCNELTLPGLDPRSSLPHAGVFRQAIKDPKDMKVGDVLSGVVQNVTPFGAFVDCGLHDHVLVRGVDLNRVRMGEILQGLIFQGWDHLNRPRVLYTQKVEDTSGGQCAEMGLHLEADDLLDADLTSELVNVRRQRQELMEGKREVSKRARLAEEVPGSAKNSDEDEDHTGRIMKMRTEPNQVKRSTPRTQRSGTEGEEVAHTAISPPLHPSKLSDSGDEEAVYFF